MSGGELKLRRDGSLSRALTGRPRGSKAVAQARAALAERLRERLPEIEATVATRVFAICPPTETADPDYLQGLRVSLATALDYALVVIEHGEERAPPLPPSLLAQARMAARHRVSLDVVLRRYFAGYSLLMEVVIEEVEDGEVEGAGPLRGAALKRLVSGQSALFDRLIAAISEEYEREGGGRRSSAEQRLAERLERLLAGELIDTSGLDYDFEGHHIGALAVGAGASEALRELAGALDCRLLVVSRNQTLWAWLGARARRDPSEVVAAVAAVWPKHLPLALGEPDQGLAGWRLTHRQAKAALPIALRGPDPFVRYADVALLATVLQDDLLATSLRTLYLEPLEAERNGGATLRETLRAYFAAGSNVSSAAVALGVSRPTVASRLSAVEAQIGCPLGIASAELEVALRLHDLEVVPPISGSVSSEG